MYFLAYSADPAVRCMASSGGFVRELLAYALRSGFVDQVVYMRLDGTVGRPAITDDPADLFTPAVNSVYQNVSTSHAIASLPPGARYAITALPCQIPTASGGSVAAAAAEPAGDEPAARLVVELFCGRAPTRQWTRELLGRLWLDESEVASFTYREGGWPGRGRIVTTSGEIVRFDYRRFWRFAGRYSPAKCKRCTRFRVGPHITAGDPWGLDDQVGEGKTLVAINDARLLPLVEGANLVLEALTWREWQRAAGVHKTNKQARGAK